MNWKNWFGLERKSNIGKGIKPVAEAPVVEISKEEERRIAEEKTIQKRTKEKYDLLYAVVEKARNSTRPNLSDPQNFFKLSSYHVDEIFMDHRGRWVQLWENQDTRGAHFIPKSELGNLADEIVLDLSDTSSPLSKLIGGSICFYRESGTFREAFKYPSLTESNGARCPVVIRRDIEKEKAGFTFGKMPNLISLYKELGKRKLAEKLEEHINNLSYNGPENNFQEIIGEDFSSLKYFNDIINFVQFLHPRDRGKFEALRSQRYKTYSDKEEQISDLRSRFMERKIVIGELEEQKKALEEEDEMNEREYGVNVSPYLRYLREVREVAQRYSKKDSNDRVIVDESKIRQMTREDYKLLSRVSRIRDRYLREKEKR